MVRVKGDFNMCLLYRLYYKDQYFIIFIIRCMKLFLKVKKKRADCTICAREGIAGQGNSGSHGWSGPQFLRGAVMGVRGRQALPWLRWVLPEPQLPPSLASHTPVGRNSCYSNSIRNSRPLSQRCHPTILYCPFSCCPQSFQAPGSLKIPLFKNSCRLVSELLP